MSPSATAWCLVLCRHAETACIKSDRSTDLRAIVKEFKRERSSKNGTPIADVTLIDKSRTLAGKLATITVAVFGAAKLAVLKDKGGEPMSFFNVVITYKDGKTEIAHYENDVVEPTPACLKTAALLGNNGELQSAVDTEQLTTGWTPQHTALVVSRDQPLSCVAFLDFTSEQPTASMPDVLHVPWIHVEEHQAGDEILDGIAPECGIIVQDETRVALRC